MEQVTRRMAELPFKAKKGKKDKYVGTWLWVHIVDSGILHRATQPTMNGTATHCILLLQQAEQAVSFMFALFITPPRAHSAVQALVALATLPAKVDTHQTQP